jgi:hypothetical protein
MSLSISSSGSSATAIVLHTCTLWKQDSSMGQRCPALLPFSIRFPATFKYGERTRKLPLFHKVSAWVFIWISYPLSAWNALNSYSLRLVITKIPTPVSHFGNPRKRTYSLIRILSRQTFSLPGCLGIPPLWIITFITHPDSDSRATYSSNPFSVFYYQIVAWRMAPDSNYDEVTTEFRDPNQFTVYVVRFRHPKVGAHWNTNFSSPPSKLLPSRMIYIFISRFAVLWSLLMRLSLLLHQCLHYHLVTSRHLEGIAIIHFRNGPSVRQEVNSGFYSRERHPPAAPSFLESPWRMHIFHYIWLPNILGFHRPCPSTTWSVISYATSSTCTFDQDCYRSWDWSSASGG